ncbi:hypothetical protein AALA98_01565 [Lachnospiraceae bacterium 45-W7]
MKCLYSLTMAFFLTFLTAAFAVNSSGTSVQPQAGGSDSAFGTPIPSAGKEAKHITVQTLAPAPTDVPNEPSEVLNTAEDGTLVVRVVESPEIDTRLTFYAVIISVIAVGLSTVSLLVSAKLQIRHNRDEVRPVVAIHLDLNDMSVKIKNHGVGPALFEKMVWKNVESKSSTYTDTLEELLREKWKELDLKTPFYIYTKPFVGNLNDPDILAPQEEIYFVKGNWSGNSISKDEKIKLGETFRDVEVEITYTDLYRKKKWILKKNLTWIANQSNI